MREEIREEARRAYQRGWCVIPLRYSEKAPDLPRGHQFLERRATPDELRQFNWGGLGIVTGELSGIVVLDVDDDAGGSDTLDVYGWGQHVTPYAWTPGGWHYYFKYDPRLSRTSIGALGPGLDLKSNGGYVVSPPSMHPSGKRYEWVIGPDELEPQEAPEWMMEGSNADEKQRAVESFNFAEPIAEGARNSTLTRWAGRLHYWKAQPDLLLSLLQGINRDCCKPPLPESEVRRIAENIIGKPNRGV